MNLERDLFDSGYWGGHGAKLTATKNYVSPNRVSRGNARRHKGKIFVSRQTCKKCGGRQRLIATNECYGCRNV